MPQHSADGWCKNAASHLSRFRRTARVRPAVSGSMSTMRLTGHGPRQPVTSADGGRARRPLSAGTAVSTICPEPLVKTRDHPSERRWLSAMRRKGRPDPCTNIHVHPRLPA